MQGYPTNLANKSEQIWCIIGVSRTFNWLQPELLGPFGIRRMVIPRTHRIHATGISTVVGGFNRFETSFVQPI